MYFLLKNQTPKLLNSKLKTLTIQKPNQHIVGHNNADNLHW